MSEEGLVFDAPKVAVPGAKHELTATDAWEHIHMLFGVGDWSPDDDQPWWQYRQQMATRLKQRMTKLGQTPADVIREADYCKAEGIDIRNAVWVTKYYYEAKRWAEQRENARSQQSIEDRISEAVSTEMGLDKESAWITKLLLAQGTYREEVLNEWTEWNRQRPRSSPSGGRARAHRTA